MRFRTSMTTLLCLGALAAAPIAVGQTTGTGSTGSTGVGGIGTIGGTPGTPGTSTGSTGIGTGTGTTGVGTGTTGSGSSSGGSSSSRGGTGTNSNSNSGYSADGGSLRETQQSGAGSLFADGAGSLFGNGAAGDNANTRGLGQNGRDALSRLGQGAFGQQNRFGTGTNTNQNAAPRIRARVVSAVAAPSVPPVQVSANVATRLNALAAVPGAAGVQVVMDGKTAVLTGSVPSDREGRVLARIVGLEPGVGRVDNRLVVAGRPVVPTSPASPSDLLGAEVLPPPSNPLIRTLP